MIRLHITLILFALLTIAAKSQVSVIPQPVAVEAVEGDFILNSKTRILYPEKNVDMQRLAGLLSKAITGHTGLSLKTEPMKSQKKDNSIQLELNDFSIPEDNAYALNVGQQGIRLSGKSPQAIFYGIQTLRQLLPAKNSGTYSVTSVQITDYPRFKWRGMLLDVCRHMFTIEEIKEIIDEMAYYKLNKLHWHLTEDQGWRIEIKKYPKLMEMAAWRNGTQYGRDKEKDIDNIRYGGYYTQDQIREIVAYASERYIDVIPEIEMPGHSVAAITAYNHLACNTVSFETGKPFEVRKAWGVSKDLLCAGNDESFTFLENVLSEVMELFPYEYIHVGGDEAPHDAWEKCPKCQQRIKNEGLKNEAELQSYFICKMEKFLNSKGKKLIGWEEIMQGGLSPDATVMSWLGTSSGIKAAQSGHHVIMCPYSHLYLDGYQASPEIEPFAIGYFTPLDKVYSFEPEHPDLKENEKSFILGVQGNLWTEFIPNKNVLEYMLYPRICALSEIGWSPKQSKNWDNFKKRLSHEMLRLRNENINYRIPTPEGPSYVFFSPGDVLELKNSWEWGEIRYTIDGTEPNLQSPLYTSPIKPAPKTVVRSAVFLPDGRRSSVWNTVVKEKSEAENKIL